MSKPRLLYRAYLDTSGGYGQFSIMLAQGLIRRDVDLQIWPLTIDDKHAPLPMEIAERLVNESSAPAQLLLATPFQYCSHDKFRTAHMTMWESTRLKKEVVEVLQAAEAVIVPCDYNVNCFSASGVDRAIYRVPLAVDGSVYTVAKMPPMKPLVFGCGGITYHKTPRKRLQWIIEHFLRAFPDDPNVLLRVKCKDADTSVLPCADLRVEIVREFLTTEQMVQFYQGCHVWVSASASGGWELMPHQAMACGRPVVASRYGGHAEYFSQAVGWEVDFHYTKAREFYSNQGLWTDLDSDNFIQTLQTVAKNPAAIRSKGKLAAIQARRFDLERTLNTLIPVLQKHRLFY